jgi:prolyl oligopeptidase
MNMKGLSLFIFFIFNLNIYSQDHEIFYPCITKDTVVDYYFSKKIEDPYRVLENFESEEVKKWFSAQNELYNSTIFSISSIDSVRKKISSIYNLQALWNLSPRITGDKVFFPYIDMKDINIERLGYCKSLNSESIELYNTKEANERDSCNYTFSYWEPSQDGKFVAFGIAPDGTERATIYIMNVKEKQLLSEKIEFSRTGNIQWLPDNSGFFYIRDKPILNEMDKLTFLEDSRTMLHLLYEDPKNDHEIVSRLLNKELEIDKKNKPRLFLFPSSDKVLLNLAKGSYYVIYYASLNEILTKPATEVVWTKIFDVSDKMGSNVMVGERFFGLSFGQNPNGRLIYLDLPDTTKKIVFDGDSIVLDDIALTKKDLFLTTIENGINKLIEIDLNSLDISYINLPFYGNIVMQPYFPLVTSFQSTDFLLFTLEDYYIQKAAYICSENREIIKTDLFPEYKFPQPIELVSKEIEVPSHDGVLVPLSIVYKKGTLLDGANPLLIETYGAYGISMKHTFDLERMVWFDYGGVYAVAHVRGGSEKGDNWYKGGFKPTKPNSWKDLNACSEYLINNKYTSPQNLAVMGASAGGITVGRAITERPDLYKAAVIYVGDLNTVRLDASFNSQVYEFGTASASIEFQYLYEMDTYHHIKEGVEYPSMLLTAGLNDSRVAPWQSAKAAAKFQEVSNGKNIVLYRIADKGHFDYPAESEIYSYLFWQLGHPDFKLKLETDTISIR